MDDKSHDKKTIKVPPETVGDAANEHGIPLENLYNECVAFQSKYGFLDEKAVRDICKKLVETKT